MLKSSLYIAAFLVCSTTLFAQKDTTKTEEEDYYPSSLFRNGDCTYNKNIKTVRLKPVGFDLGFPAISLGSNQKLQISFDVLNGDQNSYYYYRILHCDWDWKIDELNTNEYLEGAEYGYIDESSTSINTSIPYVRFFKNFPEEGTKFIMSGNYLLEVYADDQYKEIIARKRFAVTESLVKPTINAKSASTASDRFIKHEVDFKLDISRLGSTVDPFAEVKVVVQQNGRWDNAIMGLKPVFVRGSVLDFDYFRENTFNALNEFRPLNIKSVRHQDIKIKTIKRKKDGTPLVYLLPERSRRFIKYKNYGDINGQYLPYKDHASSSNVEAEYCYVDFHLTTPEVKGASVYIMGELSDWDIQENFCMKYDSMLSAYKLTALLKQGYYDYHYAVKYPGKNKVDFETMEGNHSDATQLYRVWVYFLDKSKGSHRLVGMEQVKSAN